MVEDLQKQVSYDRQVDGEISLLDAVHFLRNSWQSIATFAFLGLLGAIAYIVFTPNSYEGSSQIRMAQVSTTSPTNPFGTSVEDPVSLIARMQVPTNFRQEVISACAYQDKLDPALALSKDVKLTPIKGVANAVELKVLAPSPELAKSCSMAIFELIKSMQMELTTVFVEEVKIKLVTDDARIEAARKLIAKADQSGTAMSAAYLSARDELTFYLTDREKMVDLINSVKNRGTSLISPIYVPNRPVAPKKATSLLAGLLAGAFLGLLIALGRQFWQNLSSASKGQ